MYNTASVIILFNPRPPTAGCWDGALPVKHILLCINFLQIYVYIKVTYH